MTMVSSVAGCWVELCRGGSRSQGNRRKRREPHHQPAALTEEANLTWALPRDLIGPRAALETRSTVTGAHKQGWGGCSREPKD